MKPIFLLLVGLTFASFVLARRTEDEFSYEAERVLDNLNDIASSINDLAEMDSNKFALALRDENVAGWWGRAWGKVKHFFHRHGGTILHTAAHIVPHLLG